jgi:hypothetical protein
VRRQASMPTGYRGGCGGPFTTPPASDPRVGGQDVVLTHACISRDLRWLARPELLEQGERGQTESDSLVVVSAPGVIRRTLPGRALHEADRPKLVEQVLVRREGEPGGC